MIFSPSTLLLAGTVLFGCVNSLGVNCRGSAMCAFTPCGSPNCISKLYTAVQPIPDNSTFAPGEQIYCGEGKLGLSLCIFTQKTNEVVTGRKVKESLSGLIFHSCGKCGSIPLDPAVNDVNRGELTVNVVKNAKCKKYCQPLPSNITVPAANKNSPILYLGTMPVNYTGPARNSGDVQTS
ncbi:MAG: hypothetical protein M1825_005636 [Sarcosagium campestre]|nr:MAG: hypothetical protein M1825_005636 [Sarcosagium campestre]